MDSKLEPGSAWTKKGKCAGRGIDKARWNQRVKLPPLPCAGRTQSNNATQRNAVSFIAAAWELLSNLFPFLIPLHLQHCGRNKNLFSVESRTSFCSRFSFVSGLFLSFVSPLYSVSYACTLKRLIGGWLSEGEFYTCIVESSCFLLLFDIISLLLRWCERFSPVGITGLSCIFHCICNRHHNEARLLQFLIGLKELNE